jgi:hypothetical protein
MLKRVQGTIAWTIVAIITMQASVYVAAQGKRAAAPAAPIPTQIVTAKKVFIANGGGEYPFSIQDPYYSGSVERAYDEFYAGIKGLGRYELVGSPADADLLFEIRFTSPVVDGSGQGTKVLSSIPYDPRFRLEIRDPRTNALLWAMTEHAEWAILQGHRDKNFDQAVDRIVADVQSLATRAAGVASAK